MFITKSDKEGKKKKKKNTVSSDPETKHLTDFLPPLSRSMEISR